jgi:hypothetical protein
MKPIAILTNDIQYAHDWIIKNREIIQFNIYNNTYIDSVYQRYIIVRASEQLLSYELSAVFNISNPNYTPIPYYEIQEARNRIR